MTAYDPDPNLHEPPFATIDDAVALALELGAMLPHAHLAALSDERDLLVEATAFTHPGHTIDQAFGWAQAIAYLVAVPRPSITLVSVVDGDVTEVREDDLATFRRLRATTRPWLSIRDWLITDGLDVRSMAFTENPTEAWGGAGAQGRPFAIDDPDPGLW